MNRYGLTVAQGGLDVSRAADYQKIIDTRWPILEGIFDNEITTTFSTSSWTILYEHNLGFLPAFFHRTIDYQGNFAVVLADERYVYAQAAAGDVLQSYLTVFDVDVTADFKSPIQRVDGPEKAGESTVGLKILKSGATGGIRTKEVSEYSSTTFAKSMSVHQTGTSEASGSNNFTLTIRHNVGYPPTFLTAQVYRSTDSLAFDPPSDRTIAPLTHSYGRTRADSVDVTVTGVQATLEGLFAYIILKDPIEVAE